MFTKIVNTVKTYPITTTVTLSTLLFMAIVTPLLFTQFLEEAHGKITITSEMNISEDAIKCLESEDIVSHSINTPSNSQTFNNTDTVNYSSVTEFKCSELLKDRFSAKFEWFINDPNSSSISDQTSGSINGMTPGNHKLISRVTINVEDFKQIVKESEVNIVVNEPVVLGVSTPTYIPPVYNPTPNPQPNPQPTPNSAPSAQITSPKSGTVPATSYDSLQQKWFAYISFTGSGYDPEDGTLAGGSLQWYSNGVNIGSTTQLDRIPFYSNSTKCGSITSYTVSLVGTDSKGATGTSTINIDIIYDCSRL